MMGIQALRDRPGLSMDTSIVHGPTKELEVRASFHYDTGLSPHVGLFLTVVAPAELMMASRLERSHSGRGLHKINQYHNLRAKPQQGWVK
eukprot:1146208-Pelagomonas_calceolata.AAC.2